MNTNTAGLAGAVIVGLIMYLQYKRFDITMILNGALGGLVSVTAGADMFDIFAPIYIGAIGGIIVVYGVALFDKLRLDDPVGALSVHLLNGIWGTIAVALFAKDVSLWAQIKGILVVGLFAFTASFVVMYVINKISPFRANDDEQLEGLDINECGLESYPEFKRTI
jgi:Amt family ammonium transporter